MLAASGYKTKKDLKNAIGKPFRYTETSMFGPEFHAGARVTVVGPSPYERKWFATVETDSEGNIVKVS